MTTTREELLEECRRVRNQTELGLLVLETIDKNDKLQAENEALKQGMAKIAEVEYSKGYHVGWKEAEAEIEALKAQVGMLVDTLNNIALNSYTQRHKDDGETYSVKTGWAIMAGKAIKDLQPTADAFIKEIQDEAVYDFAGYLCAITPSVRIGADCPSPPLAELAVAFIKERG